MGRGPSLPLQTPPAAGLDFLCSCTRKKNRAPGCNAQSSSKKEKPILHRLTWLWGLAMPPGGRKWTPSLRQCWTSHQGPQLQTLWGLRQTETKMSDATRMRNSVPRKHTLFNNLPQSEQKPAEIKPEAAKNAVLKSLRSTIRIGSGVERESHSARRGEEGPDRECWKLGTRVGKASIHLKLINILSGQAKRRGAHPRKEYSCLWAYLRDSSTWSAMFSVSSMKQSSNLQSQQFSKCTEKHMPVSLRGKRLL